MAGWTHRVDMKSGFVDDGNVAFEVKRDEVVKRLRESPAATDGARGEELTFLLDDLTDTSDEHEFDDVWNEIYDLADSGQWLWIDTI